MRRPVPRLCGGYGDVRTSAPRRPGTAGRPPSGAGSCVVNAETGLGPCLADVGGFNRHTFQCGQSGSGKTYSLGVILEQLLIETDLRVVVLDPNSDFVRLGQVRAGADPALAAR